MAIEPRRPARFVDRLPQSTPMLVGVLVGVAAVFLALGIRLAQPPEEPASSAVVEEEGHGPAGDDPNAFAAWLLGGGNEGAAVDQYLAAEQELREQLARQAELEQRGDDRALVLRGLGAVAQPWEWLGPRNFGGRTRAFVISPTDTNLMLAGGITGGIWRTENRGESWVPITDTFSNISIGVLEIDPSNPAVIYAGTGEAYYRFWPRHRGNGIMKSTDGGISWAFLEATTTNDAFDWVGDIEVSHNDPARVYAATGKGVWVSTDGGASWGTEPVLSSTSSVGCMELAIRSDRQPDVVFASCGFGRDRDGVYRSIGGTSWDKVLPADGERIGFTALAIAPSAQDVIYASAPDTDQNAHGLYRSASGGDPGSWELRASPESGSPDWLANCGSGGGQGDYDNAIAVDPTDPDRVWVGGIDLFRSSDGGRTLQIASDWSLAPVENTPFVHADQHVILFDPKYDGTSNRTVYFGNDGGLYRTDDDRVDLGRSRCEAVEGIRYQSLNRGYGISQFVGGNVSDDGSIVIGGTQDNGTYRLDAGRGTDWSSIWGGDGGHGAMHPTGDWLVTSNYFTSFDDGTTLFFLYRLTGTARTGDSEACQKFLDDPECVFIGFDNTDRSMLFYPPVEQDPGEPSVLWVGGSRIWRSLDIGSNWTAVGELNGRASVIAVAPSDSNVVLVGTEFGGVVRSANALSEAPTWSPVDHSGPAAYLSTIAVHPTDPQTVYIGFKTFDGQQLWRSSGGGPFEPIDAGLPETPVNTIAINPRNPTMLYVGTDVGVFESLDGGDSWRVANENLATTIVSRLVFRRGTSELYAFTYGRGVYKVDVGDESPPVNDLIGSAKDILLAPEYRDSVDIRSASAAADDPALSCGSSLAPAQTRTVWYRLVDPGAGRIAVTTEGSTYDTVVAVHATDQAGQLTEVQCNDDSVAAPGPSSLLFDAASGVTYYIEVARSASSPTDTLANTLQLRVTRP